MKESEPAKQALCPREGASPEPLQGFNQRQLFRKLAHCQRGLRSHVPQNTLWEILPQDGPRPPLQLRHSARRLETRPSVGPAEHLGDLGRGETSVAAWLPSWAPHHPGLFRAHGPFQPLLPAEA